jgi:hypothetical protein
MTNHELHHVRDAILRLHKILLEDAKRHYERLNGPVPSPYVFLDLLVNDPFFAWLRIFSQLIVTLDEGMESDPPLVAETGFALIRARLVDHDSSSEEHQKFQDALARLPDAKIEYDVIVSRIS